MLILPTLLLACLLTAGDPPGETQLSGPAIAAPHEWVEVEGFPDGLGGKRRPRAWVRVPGQEATRRAKAVVGPDGALRVRVPPVPAGMHDLLVRRPRSQSTGTDDLLVISSALHVAEPTDLMVTPSDARPGDILEITGRFLGPRRGRVEIGSRRARVLSWETDVDADTASVPGTAPGTMPTDRVRVRVPRRLGDGVHPVTVTTAAGMGWMTQAVAVTGSAYGSEPVLRADAGGLRIESAAASVKLDVDDVGGLVRLQGFDANGKGGHWLKLSLRYDPSVQGPAKLRGDDAIMQLVRVGPSDGQVWSSAYGWGGHVRVDILENIEGRLHGTVSGWLEPVYGNAQALPIDAEFLAGPD